MNYLLDTQAALWLLADDERFSSTTVRHLDHARANVLLSSVVPWEIAIKRGVGTLSVPDDLLDALDRFAFERLPITFEHAWNVRDLPPVHRDPFDRLLVAQAQAEHATIVSADRIFDDYGVPRLW